MIASSGTEREATFTRPLPTQATAKIDGGTYTRFISAPPQANWPMAQAVLWLKKFQAVRPTRM